MARRSFSSESNGTRSMTSKRPTHRRLVSLAFPPLSLSHTHTLSLCTLSCVWCWACSMTFFNKFIDKAKQSSQQQQHSATSEVSGSEQQPSTPAQTPTKESPNSGLHKITSLLHHKPQPAPHGLATPPANSQPELSRSASLDEPSRMSLDTQGKIIPIQRG